MRQVDVLATVLLVVGALNWGLVGIARFDLVAALAGMEFGETSALTSVVYVLVGLAGAYRLVTWKGVAGQPAPRLESQRFWSSHFSPRKSRPLCRQASPAVLAVRLLPVRHTRALAERNCPRE